MGADRACHLHEELAQPPAQTFVLERRARELLVYPGSGIPTGTIHRAPGLCVSVPDNDPRPRSFSSSPGLHPADVGNCKHQEAFTSSADPTSILSRIGAARRA